MRVKIPAIVTTVIAAELVAQTIRFEHVQKDLFAAGGTFVNAWADFDSDGDLDLFVGFDGTANRLYRNDDGRFVDAAATAGVADARPTRAAAWGDADSDGDPDLLVGFTPEKQAEGSQGPTTSSAEAPAVKTSSRTSVLRLYRNTKGVFTDDTESAGLIVATGAVRQPVWVDFDGDRDLDLFVAFRDRPNAMFQNDGSRFVDVASSIGLADPRRTVGAVWFDYDEDGDLDVITGNMDGDANGLFSQDGDKFVDVAEAAGVAWGGRTPNEKSNGTVRPCVADVNNDGHFDLFFANYGTNGLFLNRGKGKFEDVSPMWGVAIDARYDSCAFGDMDNDGDLDLYVNGTVTGGKNYPDFLFRNTGSTFENVTPDAIGSPKGDHGVQWADFDRDGALDLALTGVEKDSMHWLLRNVLPRREAERSLHVRVVDENGRSTLAGAEVTLRPAKSQRVLGKRLIDAGSGYNAQNDAPLHFGGLDGSPVSVTVTAPRPKVIATEVFEGIDPQRYRGRVFELRLKRVEIPKP
jgi:FG-GAP-like repeat